MVQIFLTLFLACSPFANAIVDGKDAQKLSNFAKSVVFIVLQNDAGVPETCTGSFISPHHILTAAHCVTSDIEGTTLALGINPMNNESAQPLTIEKIFVHDEYSKLSADRNDLAIIKIKETYGDQKYIFNLPTTEERLRIFNQFDPTVTALGYGQTRGLENDDGHQDDDIGTLRYVKLSVHLNIEKTIIVKQSQGGGVCFGDSGGSIVIRLQKKKYIVGVSSGIFDGEQSATNLLRTGPIDYCKQESIFMNVLTYMPWIEATVQK